MTSLASGFAIASNPVLAQAITTDSKGLIAGEVSITRARIESELLMREITDKSNILIGSTGGVRAARRHQLIDDVGMSVVRRIPLRAAGSQYDNEPG